MQTALSTVPSPKAASAVKNGRSDRVNPEVHSDSRRSTAEGGFRFWACANGPEGRSQTTAVWGLWLDRELMFAADTESVAEGDPRVFPTSVVQLEDDGSVTVVDGSAERVDDPGLLVRFVSECEAKYGFEPDPGDPDTPVYAVRAAGVGPEAAART